MILLLFIYLIKSVHLNGLTVTEEQCHYIRLRSNEWKKMTDSYNDADYIIDNIYLGNICAAHNVTWLSEKNISYIFNVAQEWDSVIYEGIELFYFPLDDEVTLNEKNTRQYINKITNKLIETTMNNGSILIHCNMGISRSSTILVRYLQIIHNLSYKQAIDYLKSIRPVVRPNNLFKRILIKQDL